MPRVRLPAKGFQAVIPYTPRYPQTQIHPYLETHRFCVLVTHRQMGKTVCTVNHMLKSALVNPLPNARYFYVAPFLKQAKLIAWDYFKRYTAPLPGVKLNEAELCVSLPTGAKIWVAGADNPDALRGTYADGVALDEYAQIKPGLFEEIIRPMLLSRTGWAVFTGTPKGQNAFYDLFLFAQKQASLCPSEWWCGIYPADETGVISKEELENIRQSTPANIFRQEYLCDFSASADNVLIPVDLVLQAQARGYGASQLAGAPRIVGVDPARFGDDRSVIFCRQGLQAFEPQVFCHIDNMALAARVAQTIESFRPDAVFIDAGCGSGVIDRLRQLGFLVTEVPFGSTPLQAGRYANKRAEIWGKMAQWLQSGGALPKDPALKADLCAPQYDFDSSGKMRLESKEKIKERCGRSPDLGDALALTFAFPVRPRSATGAEFARSDYGVL